MKVGAFFESFSSIPEEKLKVQSKAINKHG